MGIWIRLRELRPTPVLRIRARGLAIADRECVLCGDPAPVPSEQRAQGDSTQRKRRRCCGGCEIVFFDCIDMRISRKIRPLSLRRRTWRSGPLFDRLRVKRSLVTRLYRTMPRADINQFWVETIMCGYSVLGAKYGEELPDRFRNLLRTFDLKLVALKRLKHLN